MSNPTARRRLPPLPRRRGGALLPLLSLLLWTALPALAAPVATSQGVYVDSAGGRHPWSVNAAHTLIWNGQPFLPVGGVFQAKSWGAGATEDDWKDDVAALATLKAQAVMDLCVQPARGGITGAKPEQVQRLLDHLDAEGFTYGISLNDGPRNPLTGYLVRPGAFRQANLSSGATVRFDVPNLESSLFFTVAAASGDVVDSGKAMPSGDSIQVTVPAQTGEMVVLLVPEQIHFPGSGLGYPNLWEGFDGYRDAVLAFFARVKPGKGFRFFLDALPPDMALNETGKRFIPASDGFRMEWAAWLARKYRSVEMLQTAWGVTERDLRQVSDAARLIPLWAGGKGLNAFYDVVNDRRLKADPSRSVFWTDLEAFRAESMRGYMNALADVLKSEVADAPVVYRWSGYGALFSDIPVQRGYDGIGIEAYGSGQELVTRAAGYAYSQAREAPRTLWMPVTGTQYTPASGKKEPGYPSRAVMFADLDWLREIGAKGFYVNGLRVADPARADANLLSQPQQLPWLRDYKAMLDTTAGIASYEPPVIPFPRGYAVASLRPLPGGGWWLPNDRATPLYDYGPLGQAYALSTEQGTVYYLWNPYGKRKVRLRIPKASPDPQAPRITTSDPTAEIKKEVLTLTIGPEPVSIRNLPYAPVPMDAFPEMLKEAEELLPLTRQQGPSGMGTLFDQRITWLKAKYREEKALTYMSDLQILLEHMRAAVRPYAWVEAEGATSHSFDESATRSGASGGRVLLVGERSPGRTPAVATYPLSVGKAGVYHIWVAANPGASFTFRLDAQPLAMESTAAPQGPSYADGLVWMHLGAVPITPGNHSLEIQAHGAATLDTFLVTAGEFTPNGALPPPVVPPADTKPERR